MALSLNSGSSSYVIEGVLVSEFIFLIFKMGIILLIS